MSKTLDMEGRDAAVGLLEDMAVGFKKVEVPDPNKLKTFIEGATGSVMAIMVYRSVKWVGHSSFFNFPLFLIDPRLENWLTKFCLC